MKKLILFIALIFVIRVNAQDLKKYFDEYNVIGSFVVYDLSKDSYFYYDSARCYEQFIPASTFKIPNSIIGLETSVIKDENFRSLHKFLYRVRGIDEENTDSYSRINLS